MGHSICSPVILGLDNVAHVQLTDVTCPACGGAIDHRIQGDELAWTNPWTVEAVTTLSCSHCGTDTRWTIEEELRSAPTPASRCPAGGD